MDDPTTRFATALLEFAKALVWPLALLWILHRFQTQLSDLLTRIASLKIVGNELVFQEPLRKAVETAPTTPNASELEVGPDGFLNAMSLRAIVAQSQLLASDESVTGELLIFQTFEQRTWLVATNKRVFVILDDDGTRSDKRIIQTSFDRTRTLPLKFGSSEGEGIVKFRAEETWWYYSSNLFPAAGSLNAAVKQLVKLGA